MVVVTRVLVIVAGIFPHVAEAGPKVFGRHDHPPAPLGPQTSYPVRSGIEYLSPAGPLSKKRRKSILQPPDDDGGVVDVGGHPLVTLRAASHHPPNVSKKGEGQPVMHGLQNSKCPDGFAMLDGARCVHLTKTYPVETCPYGSFRERNGLCVQIDSLPPDRVCPSGFEFYMKGCVRRHRVAASPICSPGFVSFDGFCVRRYALPPILHCGESSEGYLPDPPDRCRRETLTRQILTCPDGYKRTTMMMTASDDGEGGRSNDKKQATSDEGKSKSEGATGGGDHERGDQIIIANRDSGSKEPRGPRRKLNDGGLVGGRDSDNENKGSICESMKHTEPPKYVCPEGFAMVKAAARGKKGREGGDRENIPQNDDDVDDVDEDRSPRKGALSQTGVADQPIEEIASDWLWELSTTTTTSGEVKREAVEVTSSTSPPAERADVAGCEIECVENEEQLLLSARGGGENGLIRHLAVVGNVNMTRDVVALIEEKVQLADDDDDDDNDEDYSGEMEGSGRQGSGEETAFVCYQLTEHRPLPSCEERRGEAVRRSEVQVTCDLEMAGGACEASCEEGFRLQLKEESLLTTNHDNINDDVKDKNDKVGVGYRDDREGRDDDDDDERAVERSGRASRRRLMEPHSDIECIRDEDEDNRAKCYSSRGGGDGGGLTEVPGGDTAAQCVEGWTATSSADMCAWPPGRVQGLVDAGGGEGAENGRQQDVGDSNEDDGGMRRLWFGRALCDEAVAGSRVTESMSCVEAVVAATEPRCSVGYDLILGGGDDGDTEGNGDGSQYGDYAKGSQCVQQRSAVPGEWSCPQGFNYHFDESSELRLSSGGGASLCRKVEYKQAEFRCPLDSNHMTPLGDDDAGSDGCTALLTSPLHWVCPSGYASSVKDPSVGYGWIDHGSNHHPFGGGGGGGDAPPDLTMATCERVEYADYQAICPQGYTHEGKKACVSSKTIPASWICPPGYFAVKQSGGHYQQDGGSSFLAVPGGNESVVMGAELLALAAEKGFFTYSPPSSVAYSEASISDWDEQFAKAAVGGSGEGERTARHHLNSGSGAGPMPLCVKALVAAPTLMAAEGGTVGDATTCQLTENGLACGDDRRFFAEPKGEGHAAEVWAKIRKKHKQTYGPLTERQVWPVPR